MQTASQKAALKFPIKRMLQKMPGSYNENFLKMCLQIGISPTTARRWTCIVKHDKSSIPVDQFYKLAEFFKCTPNELLNNG